MAYTSFAALKAIWEAAKTALENIRDTTGIKKINDPVDVLDRAGRLLGMISADDGSLASIGAKADEAITDPTLSASEIALLKGLLKQLQGNGAGSLPVSLNSRRLKDVIASSMDEIIKIVGKDKVRIMLPLWEDELPYKSYTDPTLTFSAVGAPTKVMGDFGYQMLNSSSGQALQQNPIVSQNTITNAVGMTTPTTKLAVKLPKGLPGDRMGFACLSLYRVGDLPNAKVRIRFVPDNNGVPGNFLGSSLIYRKRWDRRDISLPANEIGTNPTSDTWRGLAFDSAYAMRPGVNAWVVLEYADGTGVDASNYIAWRYSTTAGSWGIGDDARAVYDGATWTVTANQPHGIKLYHDRSMVPGDDWSIIIGAQLTSEITTDIIKHLFGMQSYTYPNRFRLSADIYGLHPSIPTEIPPTNPSFYESYTIPISVTQNHLYAWTFSKNLSHAKNKFYVDGVLRQKKRGAGQAVTRYFAYPWTLGSETVFGSLAPSSNSWLGKYGPFMLFDGELTIEQVALISIELSKIREGVA